MIILWTLFVTATLRDIPADDLSNTGKWKLWHHVLNTRLSVLLNFILSYFLKFSANTRRNLFFIKQQNNCILNPDSNNDLYELLRKKSGSFRTTLAKKSIESSVFVADSQITGPFLFLWLSSSAPRNPSYMYSHVRNVLTIGVGITLPILRTPGKRVFLKR